MRLRDALVHIFTDVPSLARISGHVGLLALMVVVALANKIPFDSFKSASQSQSVADNGEPEFAIGGPELDASYLYPVVNPITIIPKRLRRDIVTYVVQSGDTVFGIAEQFELQPETILWSNPQLENDPDLLTIGEELRILPVNGVLHRTASGDTVESIAKQHKVEANAILSFELNAIQPGAGLNIGQLVTVPGGRKPIVQKVVRAYSGPIPTTAARGTGNFGWPASGVITQKYWAGHPGIDIGAPIGTPVRAADAGFVTFAGWDNTGFGKMILIEHGNGFLTLYGHLDVFAVGAGESVKKGQLIGRMGNTGRSTGPHLDFRIRQNGVWRNPFGFLR